MASRQWSKIGTDSKKSYSPCHVSQCSTTDCSSRPPTWTFGSCFFVSSGRYQIHVCKRESHQSRTNHFYFTLCKYYWTQRVTLFLSVCHNKANHTHTHTQSLLKSIQTDRQTTSFCSLCADYLALPDTQGSKLHTAGKDKAQNYAQHSRTPS